MIVFKVLNDISNHFLWYKLKTSEIVGLVLDFQLK